MKTFIVWTIVIVIVGILLNDAIYGIKLRKLQAKCKHLNTRRYKNVFICSDCGAQSEGPFKKKSIKE